MAKTFYYDKQGFYDATFTEGAWATGGSPGYITAFTSGNTLTDHERVHDMSTASAVTSFAHTNSTSGDALHIDFGSSKACTYLALYFSATEDNDVKLWKEDTTNVHSAVATITDRLDVGWTIAHFSSASSQKWLLTTVNGDIDGLTEMLLGAYLEFEVNPEIGISETEDFNTEVNTSVGGIEYAIKTGNPKTTIDMNFSSVSNTFKTNLQSMESIVQNHHKFLYSEDGASGPIHYVRLAKPIDFKEVSYNRYSCSIKLVEQLS